MGQLSLIAVIGYVIVACFIAGAYLINVPSSPDSSVWIDSLKVGVSWPWYLFQFFRNLS